MADDDTLLTRLLAGDPAGFRELVDRFHGRLLRLALGFVQDRGAAEEVVQETWVAVIKGLPTFERRSSLDTWIIRILCNRARTRGVRDKRFVPFSAFDDEARPDRERFRDNGHWATPPTSFGEEDPERLALRGEVLVALKDAIETLPPNQRVALTLRDIEGLDSNEVCNALGLTETQPPRDIASRAREVARHPRSPLRKRRGHPIMMSCSEITDQVTAYLDRRMPFRQRMEFKLHMMMCPHCRRYLRQVRTTVKLTGQLPVEPIPEEVREDLVRALLAIRASEPEPPADPASLER